MGGRGVPPTDDTIGNVKAGVKNGVSQRDRDETHGGAGSDGEYLYQVKLHSKEFAELTLPSGATPLLPLPVVTGKVKSHNQGGGDMQYGYKYEVSLSMAEDTLARRGAPAANAAIPDSHGDACAEGVLGERRERMDGDGSHSVKGHEAVSNLACGSAEAGVSVGGRSKKEHEAVHTLALARRGAPAANAAIPDPHGDVCAEGVLGERRERVDDEGGTLEAAQQHEAVHTLARGGAAAGAHSDEGCRILARGGAGAGAQSGEGGSHVQGHEEVYTLAPSVVAGVLERALAVRLLYAQAAAREQHWRSAAGLVLPPSSQQLGSQQIEQHGLIEILVKHPASDMQAVAHEVRGGWQCVVSESGTAIMAGTVEIRAAEAEAVALRMTYLHFLPAATELVQQVKHLLLQGGD